MRATWVVVLAVVGSFFFASPGWAEDDPPAPAGDDNTPDQPAPAADDQPAPAADDKPDDQPAPAADDKPDDQPAAAGDADNDGKPDGVAPDPDGDGKPGAPGDADGDGTPDTKEDSDGDGVSDADEKPAAVGDSDGDGTPDAQEDSDGDGTPDGKEDSDGDGVSDADEAAAFADVDPNAADADGDGTPDAQEDGDIDNDGIPDAQEEDPPTDPFDADGDGKVDAEEIADRKEFAEFFDDIPNQPDDKALEARPNDKELMPSVDIETFRKGVRIVKKIVLAKMAKKIAKKSDKKMATFSLIVTIVSLGGFLLLFMPLFLAKKYPGKTGMLFKYSALAAVVFVVTVNLFGGVLYGMRTVQGALSNYTNPSIAIASGTFDTLDEQADKFIVMGKELFLPTIEQMRNAPDEQPSVQLLENGVKIVQDAKVFLSIAKMFKKIDFVFGILPIILTLVTLILFVIAIKPTLMEIVALPARAAAGDGSSREVIANAMKRVKGELLASICTVGILVVLTVVSALVLGQIVKPALDAFLTYFSLTLTYLQFAEGASSGLVFVTLFAVILFLVLNLAALILSMSFFLGKSQKIFQQRFNEGTPLSTHAKFFKWGAPSVLLVQVFPWLFAATAAKALDAINDALLDGVTSAEMVSWGKLLLAGPAFLVAAFAILFWAARGLKAIKFLAGYKVKPKPPKTTMGEPVAPG
ncbi:MAG: hypothetical protein ACKV2T_22895 [Kofleriaceae bacterium]